MREEALHTGETPVVFILSGSHFVWRRSSHCLASFVFFLDFVHLNLETDLRELYFWPANNIHEAKECFTVRFMSSVDKNDCIGCRSDRREQRIAIQ